MRTRHNVVLYIHCLSCYTVFTPSLVQMNVTGQCSVTLMMMEEPRSSETSEQTNIMRCQIPKRRQSCS